MMKTFTAAICLSGLVLLAGCSKAEPRSKEYFDAHLDEAKTVVAGCRDGSIRGEECGNADLALQEAEARERGARFLRIKPDKK